MPTGPLIHKRNYTLLSVIKKHDTQNTKSEKASKSEWFYLKLDRKNKDDEMVLRFKTMTFQAKIISLPAFFKCNETHSDFK